MKLKIQIKHYKSYKKTSTANCTRKRSFFKYVVIVQSV